MSVPPAMLLLSGEEKGRKPLRASLLRYCCGRIFPHFFFYYYY